MFQLINFKSFKKTIGIVKKKRELKKFILESFHAKINNKKVTQGNQGIFKL